MPLPAFGEPLSTADIGQIQSVGLMKLKQDAVLRGFVIIPLHKIGKSKQSTQNVSLLAIKCVDFPRHQQHGLLGIASDPQLRAWSHETVPTSDASQKQ